MLTRKQYDLLMFIDTRLKDSGVSPSFEEMKEALDLRSKSGIHRLITGLEERGFIRRLPHRARALEVLRLPENREAPNKGSAAGGSPSGGTVIHGVFGAAAQGLASSQEQPLELEAVSLPLYGKIAAGTPIEALADTTAQVEVPASMVGSGDHYALTIEGDSMIDAGIFDGDTVVIRRCDTAENGAIIVALVDGQEATLKRLRRAPGLIALEPANPHYPTREYSPDRVRVQGRLVALLRSY